MNLDTIVATVGDIVQPIDGDAPEITIGLYQQAPDRPRLLDSSCSDTTNFPPDGRGPTHATVHLAEAEASLPGPSGARAITLLRRGSLDVKLSARPLRPNRQTPHTQDEVYVVVRGRGVLFDEGKRDSFEPGNCLFVAAGTEHHFEDFSEDLDIF